MSTSAKQKLALSLFNELKRRNVFKVAAAYIIVAWLLLQVVDVIAPMLALPNWAGKFVLLLLGIGFPVALIFALAYELTPEGLKREHEADGAQQITDHSETKREQKIADGVMPNSIAVLPFENLSPNPEDAYFSAGIHEEILNQLAKIKELSVIARTSVMQYAGAARAIPEIATELRVGMVMEGSVRYSGDQVRVTAQLIDGAAGTHIWTETYDGSLVDIFAIQSNVAKQIVEAMNIQLNPDDKKSLDQRPITDLGAYDWYLRARHEYGKFTTDSIKRSIEFLSKGLVLSPNSELLNLAMGYAWFNHGSAVLGADVHDQSLKRAEEYARRVLASNAGSADGKGLLGVVLFDRFETSAGLQLIREGVEAPGRNMDLLTLAALCHSIAGLTRHAEPWTEEIARLDPLHGFSLWTVGMHHLLSGRFEQAELLIRNAHELEPDAPMFRTGLGLVLIYLGRNGGAREVLEAGLEEEPRREVWHVFGRILCHILRQEQEAALQLIDGDLLGDARTDMLFSWFLADCFALLGNPKSSLEWLANAVGGGFLNHSFLKRSDPLVATLGGNEEFEALMTRAQSQFRQIEREAGVPV